MVLRIELDNGQPLGCQGRLAFVLDLDTDRVGEHHHTGATAPLFLQREVPAHPRAATHASTIDNRVSHSNLDRLSTAKSQLQNATEEFDKILEGYDMLKSLQKDIVQSEDGQAFSVMYEDLITIMRLLSENNHDFLKENLP